MVYICVICTMDTPPLARLSREHWKTLEAIISPSVDWDQLKKISPLLACSECRQQLQSMAVFQRTALIGVNHLLSLLPSIHEQKEMARDSLLLPVKEELKDSPLQINSNIQSDIELPSVKPEDIKSEPASGPEPDPPESEETDSASSDIEDNISLNTVLKPGTFDTCPTVTSTTKLEPLTLLGVQAEAKQFQMCQKEHNTEVVLVKVLPSNNSPGGPSAAAVQDKPPTPPPNPPPKKLPRLAVKPASQMVTCPGRRVEAAPGTAAATRSSVLPVLDKTERPTGSKLRALLSFNKTHTGAPRAKGSVNVSGVTSGGGGDITVGAAGTRSHTLAHSQNPKSSYFIRMLDEAEILAEREASRSAPEYAEAPHNCDKGKKIHDRTVHMSSGRSRALRYCCTYCQLRTPDESAIRAHYCDTQLIKWEPSNIHKGLFKTKQKTDKPVRCKECYAAFANKEKLKKHTERMHPEPSGPHICKICNKIFKNARLLCSHTRHLHRRQQRSVDTIDPELFCAPCARQFVSPSAYRAHSLALVHSRREDWQFACDACGRRFPTKARIEIHMQLVHLKLEPYKCDQCPRGFNGRTALRRHRAAHYPERRAPPKHVCHICASTFTIKKSLTEHLSMHAGLRPHACPLCPATFTYSAALYTHNRLKHLKIKRQWKKKPRKKKTDPA